MGVGGTLERALAFLGAFLVTTFSPPPLLLPAVHCYYRSLPFSTAQYRFSPAEGSGGGGDGHQLPFVSAVCWANHSRHCLVANSCGLLQILGMGGDGGSGGGAL